MTAGLLTRQEFTFILQLPAPTRAAAGIGACNRPSMGAAQPQGMRFDYCTSLVVAAVIGNTVLFECGPFSLKACNVLH